MPFTTASVVLTPATICASKHNWFSIFTFGYIASTVSNLKSSAENIVAFAFVCDRKVSLIAAQPA